MTDAAAVPMTEPRPGWKRLILALVVFFFVPAIPQVRAMLPVDETLLLFVPAMASCALVGWWAGGPMLSAVLWTGLAVILVGPRAGGDLAYLTLLRGWTLLLAGAFGLTCLLGGRRPFFSRALASVILTFVAATIMALFGAVAISHASNAIGAELARRNAEFSNFLSAAISANPAQWQEWTTKFPSLATLPDEAARNLASMSAAGRAAYPALLTLESIAALALAWATYHRLSRRRLGAPLAPLREFRFNDQFVWGLIVGLVILLLPTLAGVRGFGLNLIVLFGALYAIRGLAVLAWFMRSGRLIGALVIGFVMLFAPVLNVLAVLGFLTLGIAALGLGVGDTWADWRRRARSTLS